MVIILKLSLKLMLTIPFIILGSIAVLLTPYNAFTKGHLLAIIFGVFLFSLVVSNLNTKSRLFFAMAILFSILWTTAHFRAMTLPETAEWGAKMLFAVDMICIALISSFAGLFSYYFDREQIKPYVAVICALPLIAIPPLLFFDIVGADFVSWYGWDAVQFIPFFAPYLALVSVPALYGMMNLFRIRQKLRDRARQNMDLLIFGLFYAFFIPVLIDGILHPFLGFPSLGAVGITMGFLIMCIPYIREQLR